MNEGKWPSHSIGLFEPPVAMGVQGAALRKMRVDDATHEAIIGLHGCDLRRSLSPLDPMGSYALSLETRFDPDHLAVKTHRLAVLRSGDEKRLAHWLRFVDPLRGPSRRIFPGFDGVCRPASVSRSA